MKSKQELHAALRAWLEANYYAEDYELVGAFDQFRGGLNEQEQATLRTVLAERFAAEPSLVDIMLISLAGAREAAPALLQQLERETAAGNWARALIEALTALEHAEAYDAMLRFLESDLEMETIPCLARLDFARTLPLILRGDERPHILKAHLQALQHCRARRGMDALLSALRRAAPDHPDAAAALAALLHGTGEEHNPFSEDEAEALVRAAGGA